MALGSVFFVACFVGFQLYVKCKYLVQRMKRAWTACKRRYNFEKRHRWTVKEAAVIYNYTQGLCYYCHKHLGAIANRSKRWNVEHVISYVSGGPNDDVVASCGGCNLAKKDKSLAQFCKEKHIWPSCRYIDPLSKTFSCHQGVMHIESRFCAKHHVIF